MKANQLKTGFSLVELSVVLVVIGFVAAGSIGIGSVLVKRAEYDTTRDKLEELAEALEHFYQVNKRLPCVAPMDAAKTDADFGREILWDTSTTIYTSCANDTSEPDGTSRVADGSGNYYVRIGTVPTRDLRLPDNMMADEFGNRITYAVMEKQTDNAAYGGYDNGIVVTDGKGYNMTSDAMFVLVSHGSDANGSTFHGTGGTAASCNTSNLDGENCNGDATFIETLNNFDDELSLYFDDVVVWRSQLSLADCSGKLMPEDIGVSDFYGYAVALDDDTALIGAYKHDVGANSDQGAAYVFKCDDGTWRQQAKLVADDGDADDLFGHAVAVDGDTALIGAYQHDVGANADAGAAYVFTRSGTVWTQHTKLIADDNASDDHFGRGLDLDGDTALIGAHLQDVGAENNAGAAYVFTRAGTQWMQRVQLTASDSSANDNFGISVALDGDTALIGAYADDDNGSKSGSAYVFTGDGANWGQQAKLTASDGAADDRLGRVVALSGDTALLSAQTDNDGGSDTGSAYVFTRSGATWSEQAKLNASDPEVSDQFGVWLDVDGNTALIGAPYDDDNGGGSGSAYVFTRSGTGWTQSLKLVPADGKGNDRFGWGMALDGDRLLTGAFKDNEAGSNAGSAYAYPIPFSQ